MAVLNTIARLSLVVLLVGWYLTGSVTWGCDSRWLNYRYILHKLRDPDPAENWFTEEELAKFNGIVSGLPIYVAIDGMVFDVSSRPNMYGPLGSYRFFSGKDAARAFATGCFETDLTYDLRGLNSEELSAVQRWQKFFMQSPRYWHVGFVHHEEPKGPPPPHCNSQQRPSV